jgi:hypothetical protein
VDAFDELVQRVKTITGLDARKASVVAMDLTNGEPDGVFSAAEIARKAEELGYEFEKPEHLDESKSAPAAEVTMDPTIVLAEVYRTTPRVLNEQMPRVGRAPKDSVFYDAEVQAQIDALPEEIRVLIAAIDLVNGQLNVTLYDEANDVDRTIGPIDLTRYGSARKLEQAIRVLLGRLPRVLTADFN